MQNRQRHEITRDILTVCNGGSILTTVMFRSYLSHGQSKIYLAELARVGLIVYDPLESKYTTTSKGLEYLSALENMGEMMFIPTRKAAAIQEYGGR